MPSNGKTSKTLKQHSEAHEKRIIEETLRKTDGSIPRAAVLLGINRTTLWKKCQKYDIDASESA